MEETPLLIVINDKVFVPECDTPKATNGISCSSDGNHWIVDYTLRIKDRNFSMPCREVVFAAENATDQEIIDTIVADIGIRSKSHLDLLIESLNKRYGGDNGYNG